MSVKALMASYKAEGPLEERRLPSPLDDLDRNELAVARWLLWRYNDRSGECTPSDRDLAIGTGLSPRSVERARRCLRDRGLIDWRERRAAGKRGSNEYDLTAILTVCDPGQPDSSSVSEAELTDNLTELTAKTVGANRQNGAPQPVRLAEEQQHGELEGEKKGEAAAAAAASSSVDQDLEQLVSRIYGMWKAEVFPDANRPLTAARRQVIVARLGHYEPEEIESAIRNRHRSDWFSGRKPKDGRERFDLTDLLATDETLEELRDAARDWFDSEEALSGRRDPVLAGISSRPVVAAEDEEAEEERRRRSALYDAKVEAAVVEPKWTADQLRAEHQERVEDLKAAEARLAVSDTEYNRGGVQEAKADIARLEEARPDLFGSEVAA